MLVWERGSVLVDLVPAAEGSEAESSKSEASLPGHELEEKGVLVIPSGHGFRLMNHGAGSATLLHLAFVYAQPAPGELDPGFSQQSEEANRQLLLSGIATRLPGEDQQIAAGHICLAPGASVTLDGLAGFALLGLDAGELSVSMSAKALVRQGSAERGFLVDSAVLAPTDGLLVDPGTSLTLRNDGPELAQAVMIAVVQSPK
jgi:hypothetical protein